jgi:hypothetical protein
MSEKNEGDYIHPVIYYTYKDGSKRLYYSSTRDKGHFGLPKIIWTDGSATTLLVDRNGDFGLTQFAYAIVDDIKNLDNIKIAMDSEKFKTLMSFSNGVSGVGGQKYNKKVISLFRKDFWKEFI